ncbi:hypothetical protein GCM10007859_08230 [Brevundimonas denitrificans]|uniref:Lipoprotein n=1 Tax=Brevundimonas denitrificans TaxID=1443434 RepID=A0ABQ6BHA4_9CAUL|nr:hypothetical protein [Brevundimonas denitrificans]GLS00814.1 hypothetical protein GCM10007859_08230 [Brevundimonas denitrificans]
MRPLTVAAPVALLLALAACAPTTGPSHYADELRRLSDSCEARGGILVPTGQQSGRPQNDHVCRISGGATRLPNDG